MHCLCHWHLARLIIIYMHNSIHLKWNCHTQMALTRCMRYTQSIRSRTSNKITTTKMQSKRAMPKKSSDCWAHFFRYPSPCTTQTTKTAKRLVLTVEKFELICIIRWFGLVFFSLCCSNSVLLLLLLSFILFHVWNSSVADQKDSSMPGVTPIQGPIFVRNDTVPVVPLFSYPSLSNGTMLQIPVSLTVNTEYVRCFSIGKERGREKSKGGGEDMGSTTFCIFCVMHLIAFDVCLLLFDSNHQVIAASKRLFVCFHSPHKMYAVRGKKGILHNVFLR